MPNTEHMAIIIVVVVIAIVIISQVNDDDDDNDGDDGKVWINEVILDRSFPFQGSVFQSVKWN